MTVASYSDVQFRSFLVIPERQMHCWRQKTRGRVLSAVTLVCFTPPSSKKTSIQNIRIPVRQTSENIQLKKQESVQITIIIFLPQFRRFWLG